MIQETKQKTRHNSRTEAGKSYPAVNKADSKINRAYNQFCESKILLSLDSGKLYFEYLKIFSVPENYLPLQGVKTRSEVGVFNGKVEK